MIEGFLVLTVFFSSISIIRGSPRLCVFYLPNTKIMSQLTKIFSLFTAVLFFGLTHALAGGCAGDDDKASAASCGSQMVAANDNGDCSNAQAASCGAAVQDRASSCDNGQKADACDNGQKASVSCDGPKECYGQAARTRGARSLTDRTWVHRGAPSVRG